ncbi:MAG: atp4 subunit B of the stator stalk of mitochondrial F1F0 ATP synthase [Alyxoria varia]|nr:MAG: atp4 subunit B of the stator stalk of mitochondrial F1F0 ATP synthase [Alyxoria varia]
MASQLARGALRASKPSLRPTITPTRAALPATTTTTLFHPQLQHAQARYQSGSPQPPQTDPKSKAQSIIDSLPGNSLVSKTAILSSGAAASIFAISNEIYVVNEESVLLFAFLSVCWGIYNYGGPAYSAWADTYKDKMADILQSARKDHKQAVQRRMDSLGAQGEVVETTKNLFEVSKETAQLEAQAYELEQKTALAAEVKSVLESWVRYEGQIKQRQQRELAENVIAKVEKDLENPRVLKQILDQSVAEVENSMLLSNMANTAISSTARLLLLLLLSHHTTALSIPYPDLITRSQSEEAQRLKHQFPVPNLTASALQHIAPSSGSCSLSQYPQECRTATQALPFIQSSFTKYNIMHPAEQAAVVATTAYESRDFKNNVDHYPGAPGKGARNMQEGRYNLEYARHLELYEGEDEEEAARLVEGRDDASFGAAAWFLSTVCVEDVRKGLRKRGEEGWVTYVERCLGADVSDERREYWRRARGVFEQG